ncbi:MAG: hypothetical protein IKX74_05060 [Erysipelotrichaceae bacterium]|nr:hypothetical protein [Erysipelotrichaceae bacterium]
MENTELTVRLIILFIPGIIETFIYEVCRNRYDMSNRDFVINVVLSAFVMYSFTYAGLKLTGGESTFLDALMDAGVKINTTEVLLASALAVGTGFLEAAVVRRVTDLNRKKGLKNSKARLSVWDDLFDEDDSHDGRIRVILKDQDIAYEGQVEKYSAAMSDRRELCLKQAVKYELSSGKKLQQGISRIYLQIKDDEDIIIEMLKEC